MKKKVFLILFSIITFMLPSIVEACSYSDAARLKKIVSNISFSYDYIEEERNIKFSVFVNNMHNDIYFKDAITGLTYYKSETEEITINNYNQGSSIRYIFYGNNEACKDVELSIQYVSLPYYNSFYKDELCKGIEEFKLCQKWTSTGIKNYSEFKKEVYNYRQSLKDNNITEEEVKIVNQSILQIVLGYIFKYYYVVLIIIIIVCLVAIYRLNKKDSFNF